MKMRLINVATGDVLDTVTAHEDGAVTYETGTARSVVESRARSQGIAESGACGDLCGWSNGYIQFVEEVEG